MKTLRITVPEKQAQDIREIAKRRKKTPQAVAREAVEVYARREAVRQMQRAGRKIAKDLGIKTEEDVLRIFGE